MTQKRAVRFTVIALAALVAGCPRGAPPTPAGVDAAVSPLPAPAPPGGGDAGPGAAIDGGAKPVGVAVADAGAAGDPGTLPQTHDRPKSEGSAFEARAATLWDAIVHDDPDRGMPFFFPVSAYQQVKDVGSPAADWRNRLVAAYKRDIHALHERLTTQAGGADSAKLVRFDAPDDRARWVEPGEEWNKIGYWRVYGTRIVWTDAGGKERSFGVSSLISWRGEWYVVHLTGFK